MPGLIMHDWQQQVGKNSWFGAQPLGDIGNAVQLALGRNGDTRIEVFYIGWDFVLHHIWQSEPNGGWVAPAPLGGTPPVQGPSPIQSQLAVGLNEGQRLEVFYVDIDGGLRHNWQTEANGNTGWSGDTLLAAYANWIAVGQNPSGQLEVFYTGLQGSLFHNWQTTAGNSTAWAGEQLLATGKTLIDQLAVASNQDGRLEIFYINSSWNPDTGVTTAGLYHKWQMPTFPLSPTNQWSEETLLAIDGQQIAVAQNQDGHLEVFYTDSKDQLWHIWQKDPNGTTGWADAERFHGDSASQITVGKNTDGRLEIFYVGTNGLLYRNWQNGPNGKNGWNGEVAIDEQSLKDSNALACQVEVISNGDGRLEFFYITEPAG
jgi:hypothetical protein